MNQPSIRLIALVIVLSLPAVCDAQPFLLGSDQSGNLTRIDVTTGLGTLIGTETRFPLSTEIEYGRGQLYSEEFNGFTNLHTINPSTGLSTGFVTHGPAAFSGMEFVNNTLYVTNSTTSGAPSTLEIVNPGTGAQTLVGATGFGPISGLAYDVPNQRMYGVTGGGGFGILITINLGTGVGVAGPVVFDVVSGMPISHIGSIEFASNGVLYGATGLNSNFATGSLFSINPATGRATFVGPRGGIGLQGITGLTSIPEPATVGLIGLALSGLVFTRRRRS